jgi:hypothetical protein
MPREKLPDRTMAMRCDASSMRRVWSCEKPVVPMTRATAPRPAAFSARAVEASGVVKSMTTSAAAMAWSIVTSPSPSTPGRS